MGLLSLSYDFDSSQARMQGGAVAPAFRFAGGSLYSVDVDGRLERCQLYYDPSRRGWCDRDTNHPVSQVRIADPDGCGVLLEIADASGTVELRHQGSVSLPKPSAGQLPHVAVSRLAPDSFAKSVAWLLPGVEEWTTIESSWQDGASGQGALELRPLAQAREPERPVEAPGPRSRLSPLAEPLAGPFTERLARSR